MDSNQLYSYIFIGIAVVSVWAGLLYIVIKAAISKTQKQNLRLLALIAEKLGVDRVGIDAIIEEKLK